MDVEVRESSIHGKGVFAKRDFHAGETVIKWEVSKQLTEEQYDALGDEEKHYVAYVEGRLILQQEPAKYVNHSCEPNTRVSGFCDVAVRGIAKDEEITSDYADDNPPGIWFTCNCKKPNCRGTI